ncbi:translation termination factor GTPase eRF3, partial [Lunasporangiospora selenospora]
MSDPDNNNNNSNNNNGASQPPTAKLSGLSLNPSAGAFVPRAAAKAFVPSWMPSPAATSAPSATTNPTPAASSGLDFNTPPPAAVLSKTSESGAAKPGPPTTVPAPAPTPASKPTPPIAKSDASLKKKDNPKPAGPSSSAAASASASSSSAPAVAASEEPDEVDQGTLTEFFGKEHMNVIFIGHVDAGKSTMGGRILEATGMIDKRTLEKYEKDAKEAGRDSWYLSWALDTNAEERAKGKTVEVGRAYFETDARRYTILDAPGHKTYVPSMIGGAAQADVAVLVISARKGEFETGFEKGGQTREHAVLAKNGGVNKLVVVINKMDDLTVQWAKERYDECVEKLSPFLKANRYNLKTDVIFMPVSGYTGANIKRPIDPKDCDWYTGPTLLDHLDSLKIADRKLNAPFRMPVSEKYKDMGAVVVGKIDAGSIKKGGTLLMMPNAIKVEVQAIFNELEEEIPVAVVGDNIRFRLRGIEEE